MNKDRKWALIDLKAACKSAEQYIQHLITDIESMKKSIKVLEEDGK